jgi:hypothetical protein
MKILGLQPQVAGMKFVLEVFQIGLSFLFVINWVQLDSE